MPVLTVRPCAAAEAPAGVSSEVPAFGGEDSGAPPPCSGVCRYAATCRFVVIRCLAAACCSAAIRCCAAACCSAAECFFSRQMSGCCRSGRWTDFCRSFHCCGHCRCCFFAVRLRRICARSTDFSLFCCRYVRFGCRIFRSGGVRHPFAYSVRFPLSYFDINSPNWAKLTSV